MAGTSSSAPSSRKKINCSYELIDYDSNVAHPCECHVSNPILLVGDRKMADRRQPSTSRPKSKDRRSDPNFMVCKFAADATLNAGVRIRLQSPQVKGRKESSIVQYYCTLAG
jgi:hypothetical protein